MAITRALSIRWLICVALLSLNQAWADDLKDIVQQSMQGQPSQALERINAHVVANPNDVQALFMRAVMLAEQGKKDDAIKAFTEITTRFPGLPEPFNNLAVLYADRGEYDKARQALESAIKTHPSYATAQENLGDVYAKMASEAYGKALSLDNNNPRAQNKMLLIKELFSVTGKTGLALNGGKPAQISTEILPSSPTKLEAPRATTEVKSTSQSSITESPNQAVEAALRFWVAAWSSKDINGYLSMYAENFEVPGNLSRKDWEAMRRDRLNKPQKIDISINNLKIKVDDKIAKISLKQHYHSGALDETTSKTIEMINVNGKWLIQKERAGSQ
jgi:TPR repeat/Tetratricopeptide repeat